MAWFGKSEPPFDSRYEQQGAANTEVRRTGTLPDQDVVGFYFRTYQGTEAHPVATDSFLELSREQYGANWLGRELVQNFVDHNPENPGTLDGVEIEGRRLLDGKTRFTIRGRWPFEDPTGLISLHSEKPADMRTAGGNGLGIKQVAIRLLRDYGVGRFAIQGEGWEVDYQMAYAEAINIDWRRRLAEKKASPIQKIKHDWLRANYKQNKSRGEVVYTIETDDPELLAVLEQLSDMGVSRENRFLQNPDFENEHGAIKWLPHDPDRPPPESRLFINGQVMSFRERGGDTSSNKHDWPGPEYATVRLNNIEYKMNVDRPAISVWDLRNYSAKLIESMDEGQLVDQLKASEHLWSKMSGNMYSSSCGGAFVLIHSIVNRLAFHHRFDADKFAQHFGGKGYLAHDGGVTDAQEEELRRRGFVVCDSYFESIGMPKASSELSSVEKASELSPSILARAEMQRLAEKHGMEVGYEDVGASVNSSEQLFQLMARRLADTIAVVEQREEKDGTWRVRLKIGLPKDLLFHALPRPKEGNRDQEALHFLRGAIQYGLSHGIFQKVFLAQGQYVSTFRTESDSVTGGQSLFVRNVETATEGGVFVEFEVVAAARDTFEKTFVATEARAKPGASGVRVAQPSGAPTANVGDAATSVLKPEQRTASPKVKDVRDRLEAVPVEHPPIAAKIPEQKIDKVPTKLPPEEEARLLILEERLPGIRAAVEKLAELSDAGERVPESVPAAVSKYVAWRESGKDFYGQAGVHAGYLSGRRVIDLLVEHTERGLEIGKVVSDRAMSDAEREILQLKAALKMIAERLAPEDHEIQDFEIILEPSSEQLARLGMLRAYLHTTAGVALPNDLFVYRGKSGALGINLVGKAIGIHENVLAGTFEEALSTFAHETVHNDVRSHDEEFILADEALHVEMQKRLAEAARKLAAGRPITDLEAIPLDIRSKWGEVRAA